MSRLHILAIADIHSPGAFHLSTEELESVDLVLTLGDIGPGTVDLILDRARRLPVFGVLGNHDAARVPGLVNLHRRTAQACGLRLAGFGGARRYKTGPNHYTGNQVWRQMFALFVRRRVDLVISHAPPLATSRDEDRVHRGFAAFDRYIRHKQPAYWLHGHLGRRYRERVGATTVIGVDGKQHLLLDV